MKKISLLFLIISSLSFTISASHRIPGWFKGNWSGIGYQIDGKTWDIQLTVDQKNITISYPSLNCKGNWTIHKSKKNSLVLNENINPGNHHCDNGCLISIFKINSNEISVVYYLPSYSNKAIAWAVLAKD